MRISLIHPSRSRPEKAKATYDYWISKSSSQVEIEHILSLDFSDPLSKEYDVFLSTSIVLYSHNTCVVEATNIAAKQATGDILIYLSDDFKCPNNWDLLILDKIQSNKPQLLKVDDCLQKFEVAVLTIPIMNRKLYETLSYFWHPDFKSMFCDEHLYWITKNNGWLYLDPELKFPHEHPCNGKSENDETYKRSAANWDQGKATFAKHKELNFPL